MGYYPFCIVRKEKKILYCNVEIVLQETGERAVEIVLQDGCLGLKLYCNTVNVLQAAGDKIVSQYKIVLRQKGKVLGRGAGARGWACTGVGA